MRCILGRYNALIFIGILILSWESGDGYLLGATGGDADIDAGGKGGGIYADTLGRVVDRIRFSRIGLYAVYGTRFAVKNADIVKKQVETSA